MIVCLTWTAFTTIANSFFCNWVIAWCWPTYSVHTGWVRSRMPSWYGFVIDVVVFVVVIVVVVNMMPVPFHVCDVQSHAICANPPFLHLRQIEWMCRKSCQLWHRIWENHNQSMDALQYVFIVRLFISMDAQNGLSINRKLHFRKHVSLCVTASTKRFHSKPF